MVMPSVPIGWTIVTNYGWTYHNSWYSYFAAFEFLDDFSMNLVETHLGLHNPISKQPFYVLVETSGSNSTHDEQVCS